MADPFLKKKWERVFFTFFDLNKSNSIDWGDFSILLTVAAQKIKELRGEDSNEYKIATDAMLMVWRGLLNATKGIDMLGEVEEDIHISKKEWDEVWEKFDPKHMPIWQWEYLKYMFFLLDASGDKFIDEEEYVKVMQIYSMKEKEAKAAFKKFCVDASGKPIDKIDYGGFVKRWNEYFTSKDKKSPGNYLFGDW